MVASEGIWDMDLTDMETMVDSVEVEEVALAVDEDSVVAVVGDLVVEEDLVASGDLAGIEDSVEGEVEVEVVVATPRL